MALQVLYRVEKYGANYMLRAHVGSNVGKPIGEARFQLLPDGERVELESLFACERHRDLLAPELLHKFERLVRFFQRSAVWLEAVAQQKNFYLARGYSVITEHGNFCYMQKDLA